jgi:hypothetical protein
MFQRRERRGRRERWKRLRFAARRCQAAELGGMCTAVAAIAARSAHDLTGDAALEVGCAGTKLPGDEHEHHQDEQRRRSEARPAEVSKRAESGHDA